MSSFKSEIHQNIGVTPVAVYTVPALTSTIIIGLECANTSAAYITCSVTVTKGGTTVYYIKDAPIPTGATLSVISGQKLVVNAADIVKVISSDATSIDATISFLEGV